MHSAGNRRGTQITSLRESGWSPWPMRRRFWVNSTRKKQGRRRSITPSGLASPDIEIGLRRPVN